MKKLILAAFAAGGIVATPAIAGEKDNFSGFKGAALIGYDNGDFGAIVTLDGVSNDYNNAEGAVFGLSAGYDRQSGGIVYGIELEALDSAADVDDRFLGEIKLGRDLYAGGRLGYAISSRTLIYAKAGYANTRLRTVGFRSIGLDGFRVGGGAEHRLGKKLFLRAEYRFSEYDRGFRRNQAIAGVGLLF
ncbi:outer membrane immunogenic protein [Parasphingorhabdus marina DSM 22363]|uniref:Outer membrane immunogenic protein n=2 Tax=Parasphingorhabdus marina TaxID=394732 RepID=A0A1N6ES49_9SPHN|nr:outer membrane immunogenic protein [Parasphingorhabdus marina DSM 22363]